MPQWEKGAMVRWLERQMSKLAVWLRAKSGKKKSSSLLKRGSKPCSSSARSAQPRWSRPWRDVSYMALNQSHIELTSSFLSVVSTDIQAVNVVAACVSCSRWLYFRSWRLTNSSVGFISRCNASKDQRKNNAFIYWEWKGLISTFFFLP